MTKRKSHLKRNVLVPEIMLWSELPEEYESLRVALYEEWSPEGVTEEYEVKTLVQLLWRRRRLDLYEQIATRKRRDDIRLKNEQSRHIQNLKALAPQFSVADTAEKVNALLSQLSPLYRGVIQRDWPLGDADDPCKWGSRIATGLSGWTPPARQEDAEEFLAAIDPLEMFDQSLSRIERIDAMIDKTIKRLVQIKTMKQMYRQLQPKLVTATIGAVEQSRSNDQSG